MPDLAEATLDRVTGVEAVDQGSPPTLLLGALDGTRQLADRLDALLAAGAQNAGAWPSFGAAPSDGPARLAVVDVDPRRLELARKVVAQGRPWRGRNGVWFEPRGLLRDGGRLAFVFPGVEPTFEPRVDDVAEHFGLQRLADPLRLDPNGGMSALERQSRGIIAVGRLLAPGARPSSASLPTWSPATASASGAASSPPASSPTTSSTTSSTGSSRERSRWPTSPIWRSAAAPAGRAS